MGKKQRKPPVGFINGLQKSFEIVKVMFDSAPDAYFIIDTQGNFVDGNAAAESFVGYKKEELVGKSFFQSGVLETSSIPKAMASLARNVLGFSTGPDEYTLKRKDGSRVNAEVTSVPVTLEGKSLIVGIARDVTRRKQTEAVLRESEARYRTLFDLSPSGILVEDEHGTILQVNDAICSSFGYTRDELIGKKVQMLAPPEMSHDVDKNIAAILAGGVMTHTVKNMKKDGSVTYRELTESKIVLPNGERGIIAVSNDITDRVLVEEALHESEERYRSIVDSTSDVAYSATPNGTITFVSHNAVRWGFSPEEIIDHNIIEFVHPDDLDGIIHGIEKYVKSGTNIPLEFRFRLKDGRYCNIEGIGNLVYKYGKLVRITGLLRDITERKKAEEELKRSELQYRTLFNSANDSILIFEPKNEIILDVNPKACEVYGFSRVELVGSSLKEITKNIVRGEERIRQTVLDGRSQLFETEHFRKDGTSVCFLANTSLIEYRGRQAILSIQRDITDRKEAEEALRKSEQKYRTIFENIQDIFYQADMRGTIIDISPSIERYTGYMREELIGNHISEIYAKPRKREHLLKEIFRAGEVRDYEIILRTKNDRLVYASVNSHLLKNSDGDLIGIEGSLRDITERKKIEEALYRSEESYRGLFNSVTDAIYVQDREGYFLDVNQGAVHMYGYPREFFIGKRPDVLSAPGKNDIERIAGQIIRAFDGEPQQFEFWGQRKNGEIFPKDVRLSSGKYFGQDVVIAIARDMTQRKNAEEALRESMTRNRAILNAIPDLMFLQDREGVFLEFHAADASFLPIPPDQFIGKYMHDVYPAPLVEQFGKSFELVARTGRMQVIEYEMPSSHDMRHCECRSVPIDGGRILSIVRDVTDQKNLEKQLYQVQKLESLGTLAGGIAHDFNNLLAIILGYTNSLAHTQNDQETFTKKIGAIEKAVERGTSLVRQILTFARKTGVDLQPVNVNAVIGELAKMLGETFPKTITLSLQLDRSVPIIQMDSTQLHQALLNLCVNARDAMHDQGTITLSTELTSGKKIAHRFPEASGKTYVVITVADTGEGIKETAKAHIFEPFFTTKEKGKGTGLGLAVVYGIVRAHQGFIDVESEHGHGSAFKIYLPVTDEELQSYADSRIDTTPLPGGTETILLVEDETMLLELVQSVLCEKGYTVLTAMDGDEGLSLYKKEKASIDLVFTDLGLPRLAGTEMVRKLKEIDPSLTIIVGSGFIDPSIREELLNAGASEILQKPYKISSMLCKIREVLDARKNPTETKGR